MKEQVEEAKAKLLFEHENRDSDSLFWRTVDATKLRATILNFNIGSLNDKVFAKNFPFFKLIVAARVLHKFMFFYVTFLAS